MDGNAIFLTTIVLTIRIHVSSGMVVVRIVSVFILPLEHPMDKPTCCSWLRRIDGGNR